jgi:hypothetical protein
VTGQPERAVLERLQAVTWDDWDTAVEHTRSRAALMREYLRRAACWAKAVDAEDAWPFFDIAQQIDPATSADEDVKAELEDYLWNNVGRHSLRETCRGAVHWAALRARSQVALPDLPDPYDPLLTMYERGGGFFVEEFIDLNGIMVPFKTLDDHLSSEPVTEITTEALDALDAP